MSARDYIHDIWNLLLHHTTNKNALVDIMRHLCLQIRSTSDPIPSYLQRTQSSTSFADANDDAYSEVVLRPHNVETRKVVSALYTPPTPIAPRKDFSNGVLQYKVIHKLKYI